MHCLVSNLLDYSSSRKTSRPETLSTGCIFVLIFACLFIDIQIYPNHGVHLAGFVVGFFIMLILLSLGFLAMNLIGPRTGLNLLQQRVLPLCTCQFITVFIVSYNFTTQMLLYVMLILP